MKTGDIEVLDLFLINFNKKEKKLFSIKENKHFLCFTYSTQLNSTSSFFL